MWKKDEKEEKLKLLELAIEEYINTPDNAKNLATIQKKYGFKRATISKHLKNKSSENYNNLAFKLHYTNAKARVVARKLYENSNMYLNRKYNIYKEFCRFEEESSIAKSTKIGESCDANTEVNN